MYWLEYWWLLPVALGICVLVCSVGVEGALLFAPFYAVVFPWLAGVEMVPLQAIQIGIFTEIVGFTSSFVGFLRAGLIDFRLGARITAIGIPAAVIGVLLAYRMPQALLLVIVALAMPALAWYIRHPPQAGRDRASPARTLGTVRAAAARIPFCCYASANLYASGHQQSEDQQSEDQQASVATATAPAGAVEHRDRNGRAYRYDRPRGGGQAVVGSLGGASTGLIGFGVGVLGVAYLVIQRIPMRIAVGTSHFVILVVTGVAVLVHLVEMHSVGITPPWNIVAVNAAAVLVGGQLAAWLAGRVREDRLRTILIVLLAGLSLITLFRAGTLLIG